MDKKTSQKLSGAILLLLILSVVTLVLTPLSSELPDGLEHTAETLSFADAARDSSALDITTFLGDWPAALVGTLLTAILVGGLVWFRGTGRTGEVVDGQIRNS